ncbi:hypothetical protein MKX01_033519 [Papaver californicum]|nr:hypothetical protein MKX01_033519 [Papaver californicum]
MGIFSRFRSYIYVPARDSNEVSAIITAVGVRSVNLIVGVCFASREGCAVTETTLHHINEENPICSNKYERQPQLLNTSLGSLKRSYIALDMQKQHCNTDTLQNKHDSQ